MSPLTGPLSRPALPQVEGAGDFSIREYEQVAGAITETGTLNGKATLLKPRPTFLRSGLSPVPDCEGNRQREFNG